MVGPTSILVPKTSWPSCSRFGRLLLPNWCFDVHLIDLGSPRRRRPVVGGGEGPEILAPGPSHDREFASPLTRSVVPVSGMAALRVEERMEGNRLRMSADCRDLQIRGFLPGDYVGIRLDQLVDVLWVTLAATKRHRLEFEAEVPAGHPCLQWDPSRVVDVKLVIEPRYGPECDVFGLGMLLMRSLLVNDSSDAAGVRAAIDGAQRRFEVEVERRRARTYEPCRDALLEILAESRASFDQSSVLYSAADRHRYSQFDPGLWSDLLVLGFRLTTVLPGFSLAVDDEGHRRTGPIMGAVLADVRALLRRVHVELFARTLRDSELRSVCEELRSALREELAGAGAGAAAPGAPDSVQGANSGVKWRAFAG